MNEVALTDQQMEELTKLLLNCSIVSDSSGRSSIIGRLPPNIQHAIPNGHWSNATQEVFAIVKTCNGFEGGLNKLIEAVGFFGGENIPFQKIRDYMKELNKVDHSATPVTNPQTGPTINNSGGVNVLGGHVGEITNNDNRVINYNYYQPNGPLSQQNSLLSNNNPNQLTSDQVKLNLYQYLTALQKTSEEQSANLLRVLGQINSAPDILSFVIGVNKNTFGTEDSNTSDSLLNVVQHRKSLAIVAEVGYGKTTALWQIIANQIKDITSETFDIDTTIIPVYIDLTNDIGIAFSELLEQSLNSFDQTIASHEMKRLANNGQLLLALDNFDLASKDVQHSLNKWKKSYPKNCLIITTHKPVDAYNLDLPAYNLLPLDQGGAKVILSKIPQITEHDIICILQTLEENSQYLASSPLLLQMIAYIYLTSKRTLLLPLGELYEQVINGVLSINQKKGFNTFEKSDKHFLLSLLADWMQQNRITFITSNQLAQLLNSWIFQITSISHLKSVDIIILREELLNSGVLKANNDDKYEFIHSTFMAYFSALTITVERLPILVKTPEWEFAILLWASSSKRPEELLILIDLIRDKLILLGKVTQQRSRNLPLGNSFDKKEYFDRFSGYIVYFLNQIPVFLTLAPWRQVKYKDLQMSIAEGTNGYTIVWHISKSATAKPDWINVTKLARFSGMDNVIFWLISSEEVQQYHPLELAYCWLIRSFWELVQHGEWNSEVSLEVVNSPIDFFIKKFQLIRKFLNLLPLDLLTLLPYNAQKGVDIKVEIDETVVPIGVRYSLEYLPDTIEIKQTLLVLKGEVGEEPLFSKNFEFGDESSNNIHNNYREYGTTIYTTLLTKNILNSVRYELMGKLSEILPAFPYLFW